MQYKTLGDTGLLVSTLCFGAMTFHGVGAANISIAQAESYSWNSGRGPSARGALWSVTTTSIPAARAAATSSTAVIAQSTVINRAVPRSAETRARNSSLGRGDSGPDRFARLIRFGPRGLTSMMRFLLHRIHKKS